MVHLTIPVFLTVAQVVLHAAPAFGGPIDFTQLEARAGRAFAKKLTKDLAVTTAQKYVDDNVLHKKKANPPSMPPPKLTLPNKSKPNTPPAGGVALPAMAKYKTPLQPAAKGPIQPQPGPSQNKPSIAEQAKFKHALNAANKNPMKAALNNLKQKRSIEFSLEERDLEDLYDLVARDLYFDLLEARDGLTRKRPLRSLD